MKSIYEELVALKVGEWDYYLDRGESELDESIEFPFIQNNQSIHLKFIENYFKIGGKGDVYESFKVDEYDFDRPAHTNSVFFIGCLFYKHLNLKGKMQIEQFGQGDHFFFVWFMTILSHDLSYRYENDFCNKKSNISDNIEDLQKELKVGEDNFLKLLEKAIEKSSGNIETLVKNTKHYYTYRYNEHCSIDHGIVAGLQLYSALEKNRKKKEKGNNEDKGGLYWGPKLVSLYMTASLGVLLHNIWAPQDSSSKDLYEKYKMKELSDAFPISFHDMPFLVLLGIIDTLDPVKIFNDRSPQCVLKSISICFVNGNTIVFEESEESCIDFSKLHEKAKGLVGWLDVKVSKKSNPLKIVIKGL